MATARISARVLVTSLIVVLGYVSLVRGQADLELSIQTTSGSLISGFAEEALGGTSVNGFLILEGKFMEGPYYVQPVPNGVEVNGHFIAEADLRHDRSRRGSGTLTERILRRLSEGGMLLGWKGAGYALLGPTRAGELMFTLASKTDVDEALADFQSLQLDWISRSNWEQLAEQCDLPNDLREELISITYPGEVDSALLAPTSSFGWRLQTTCYMITIAGIGACVFSLGTLLSYRPAESLHWKDLNPSPSASKLVIRSVLLLAGLGVLDLVCTTISQDTASGFFELNPLASAVVGAPWLLAAFKIGATVMSCAILIRLRHYHGAQVASWWLALFCTVLAMRWVSFNSMFLT